MLLPGAGAGMEGFPVNWEYELLAAQLDKGGALRALIRAGPALAVAAALPPGPAAGIYLGAARWALELRWKTPAPNNSSGKPRHNLLSLPRRNAAAGERGLLSTHKRLSLSSGRGGSPRLPPRSALSHPRHQPGRRFFDFISFPAGSGCEKLT